MTKQEIFETAYRQLALDMSCTVDDIISSKNVYCGKKHLEGRRLFNNDKSPLSILCINNKVVFSGDDDIVSWCRERFDDVKGGWFTEFDNLRILDARLLAHGHRIMDSHCFFLPDGESQLEQADGVCWYEKDELERFRGDERFEQALGFEELRPDELAVTFENNGQILAMAGVSSDSDLLWQIGINTLPEAEGRGLGKYLVTLLKNEVIRRGKVPYYGCHFSHSISQRIAIGAGFTPVWSEIYTR
ncbi:MAG: GNAT family N-acetyltransferase [Ruminococcaceae bacterium]|nr:GNAT family N-acetyltransferase [Oscillospiraceae bacterium]